MVVKEGALPPRVEEIFAANLELDALFTALMPALCEVLNCDRCFLYIRNPEIAQGKITHCYCTSPEWNDLTGESWDEEDENITAKDPLMALAYRTPEAIFVDDIETAGSDLVNREYEQDFFKHRALIHAPIYCNGQFCGVLEPCVFHQPRPWTEHDRQLVAAVQARLAPLVSKYLKTIT